MVYDFDQRYIIVIYKKKKDFKRDDLSEKVRKR